MSVPGLPDDAKTSSGPTGLSVVLTPVSQGPGRVRAAGASGVTVTGRTPST